MMCQCRFTSSKKYTTSVRADNKEAMHVRGQRIYGKFLLLPPSFSKGLKLLQKSKSIFKKKIIMTVV